MFVNDFYTKQGKNYLISRQQGSDFAKSIAGDYNPLHQPDNSRFCVPGDLLFSLTLAEFGVSQSMTFTFKGMVGGDVEVSFIETEEQLSIEDSKQKSYLQVDRSGKITRQETFVESLIRSYVAFSGETFPNILVKLMKKEGVMINPERPMVIYEKMHISFSEFREGQVEVRLLASKFDVNGKRGLVTLEFDLCVEGISIGRGEKQIIMGGLRPYEQAGIDLLVHNDNLRRDEYLASLAD